MKKFKLICHLSLDEKDIEIYESLITFTPEKEKEFMGRILETSAAGKCSNELCQVVDCYHELLFDVLIRELAKIHQLSDEQEYKMHDEMNLQELSEKYPDLVIGMGISVFANESYLPWFSIDGRIPYIKQEVVHDELLNLWFSCEKVN